MLPDLKDKKLKGNMLQRIFNSLIVFCFFLFGCNSTEDKIPKNEEPYLVVLGIAQDGGYPQAGTKKSEAWENPSLQRKVVCLGILDPANSQRWMIEATPDFKEQLHTHNCGVCETITNLILV